MITGKILKGGVVTLRQIEYNDCTPAYVNWLNDPEVNQYLETRWIVQTPATIKEFVKSQRENNHSILFAIILNADDRHIGNIKIGPINSHHHNADISYFIGDKNMWNKGIATECINLVSGFGFSEFNLNRIEAGTYAKAIGSWKALEKNGFIREGVFRKKVLCGNDYIDAYRYGLLASEYRPLDKLIK